MSGVVITATGVISAAGTGASCVLEAMAEGVTFFKQGGTWPAATIDPAHAPWPDGKPWVDNRKYANVAALRAVAAARLALQGDQPRADADDGVRCGIVMAVGSSASEGLGEVMPRLAAMAESDPRPLAKLLYDEVPDYSYIRGIPSQIGQFVAIASSFRGSNVAVYGEGGAGGLGAMASATRLLESSELDRVLVVGVQPPLMPTLSVAFDREDPLGTEATPGRGPFDVERTGTLIGEGAVALMLERADVATARGVTPLAHVLGCETICATARGRALGEAVSQVMGQGADQPDCWWAHGTGSIAIDREECHAVGSRAVAPTTSSKGTIGNAFECAGLIDVALAVEALHQRRLPPVGLLRRPDPVLGDIDFVLGAPRALPAHGNALVTALNHGGNATTAAAALISTGGTS